MIIYFTGTGNSRYIAKSLAQLVKDELVSSNDYLPEAIASGRLKKGPATYKYFLDTKTDGNSGDNDRDPDVANGGSGDNSRGLNVAGGGSGVDDCGLTFTSAKPYVFICPVYCAGPSMLFFSFLKTCRFSGNRKAYFILNGNGTTSISSSFCKELCQSLGLKYMGDKTLAMPQNYIAYFTTHEKEECKRKIKAAGPGIARIALYIRGQKALPQTKHSPVMVLAVRFVLDFYFKFFVKTKAFQVSDACISCGKCASVCPLGNISLLEFGTDTLKTENENNNENQDTGKNLPVDRRPVWGDQCTHCMACINLCPKDAIEYGKHSKGKPRYRGVFSS